MLKQKIEIIAPFPPPYGGIANHIGRLVPFLDENKLDYRIWNHGFLYDRKKHIIANNKKVFWYLKFLFRKTKNIIHFHQTLFGLQYLYWFIYSKLNNNSIIVTLHNESLLKQNIIFNKLNIFLLKNTDNLSLVVVSKKVNEFLYENKIESIYLPAYISPKVKQEVRISNEKYNIFCNIWKIVDETYIEKYGIDLILDLIKDNKNNKMKLYIFIGNDKNINILHDEINKRNLNNMVEIKVSENLVDHFYYADLLIRANRDDAFGVSIQEAHDCNVPTISSDICERPKGTYLFENGSLTSLIKVFEILKNKTKEELLANVEELKYHMELIKMYKNLMEKNK